MADVIITLKVMPESPEVDMEDLKSKVKEKIESFVGETETKDEIEPVAFGLKALKLSFVMDEEKGSPEELENSISEMENVNSCEVADVRRSIG